jgi:sarcosine oxidase gamma subunit
MGAGGAARRVGFALVQGPSEAAVAGPAFVPFTVTVSASSGAGLRYAYVHGTNAAVAASYDSTGGVNTVTTLGPGEWLVCGCPVPPRPR